MLEFDGSTLEGGGQILRTAIALSAILKKPCRVFNIRKGRKKPGLAIQHLLGIQSLAQLCGGQIEGGFLGSTEIIFYPGSEYKRSISINIPTAGSITLILQVLTPLSHSLPFPIEVSFKGGATDTFFSPTIDYFKYVFSRNLEKVGGMVEVEISKRGYYPEGGASVKAKIHPAKFKPINLTEREDFEQLLIFSGASATLKNKKVAERQIMGVKEVIGKLKLPIKEKVKYYETDCPGSHICLVAEFKNTIIGVDNLGKLGKRAEDVGKEAVLELLKEEKSKACLDKNMGDQILPFLALIKEKSKVTVSEITNHCKTNMWVIEKFGIGKFETKNNLITWLPTV